jgi:spore coat polysaccharide biosynthesis protein SpsF (cytidylyltransferase family)
MRTVAVVQARMGSTRLPGKVMADLGGRPLLALVLERTARTPGVDETVVATTDLPRDDAIAVLCGRLRFPCVRGSEDDVLDRYQVTANRHAADLVVRITADCPLVDPAIIGRLLALRAERGYGWAAVATGALPPALGLRRFPDGLDGEVFTAGALDRAWRLSTMAYDREHVTPFMGRDDELTRGRLEDDEDHGGERWTVDHPADLDLVRAIVGRLGRECSYADVLALLDREPELRAINAALVPQPSRT